MIFWANSFGRRLTSLFQKDPPLFGWRLSCPDHAVNFSQSLGGTVAEVVENLFSGRKHDFVLVRGNVDGVVLGQLHAARGAGSDKRVGGQRRGVRHVGLRVLEGERLDLFDVDVVVELDEVSPLLLLQVAAGPGEAGGRGRGAAGLGDGQGAAGPHDGAGVSAGSVFAQLCGRILMASAFTAARVSSFPLPSYQNTSIHLAPGLWLRPVATHDVLEGLVLFGDFCHHVNGTHQQLVQMSVHHKLRTLNYGELKAGPDFFRIGRAHV